jgi:hypothetical protein
MIKKSIESKKDWDTSMAKYFSHGLSYSFCPYILGFRDRDHQTEEITTTEEMLVARHSC